MTKNLAQARRFDTESGVESWTVVDALGLPITPIEEYLFALRAAGRAKNTVRSYARNLSQFWRWLAARQIDWEALSYADLSDFMFVYSQGIPPLPRANGEQRSAASTRSVAASVKEFIEHHRAEGRGPTVQLTRSARWSSKSESHFRSHADRRRPGERNRLTAGHRESNSQVKIIDFENDFRKLQKSALTFRDRLVVSALYDGGLRIGQALGLRHEDLIIPEKRLFVVRRENNRNRAVSKSRQTLDLPMPSRFFDLYSRYLLEELVPRGIESEFVFVNLDRGSLGEPCSYPNMYQQLLTIAGRANIAPFHPHMLRHTHGTSLAKAGWTSAEIAARLGHRYAATADIYIHLASSDLDDKFARTIEHLERAGL